MLEILKPTPRTLRRARAAMAFRYRGDYIKYRLGAGGMLPGNESPASIIEGSAWCDCSGFVSWCFSISRRREGYNKAGSVEGYINTDAMVEDAFGIKGKTPASEVFERVEVPKEGDAVVYRGRFAGNKRVAVGHTGIVSFVPEDFNPKVAADWERLKVVHCNAATSRAGSGAIAETAGGLFYRGIKKNGGGGFVRRAIEQPVPK